MSAQSNAYGADPAPRSEFAAALAACTGAFAGVAVISAVSSFLMLTGSFFMLEVYDRVLPSRSLPTLTALAVLATGLFFLQGALDVIRGRVLVRISAFLDESLSGRIYDAVVRLPLTARGSGDGLQPLRDFDLVRGFLSGAGPMALFDLPWIPFYLFLCFVFHFWIGVAATAGAVVLIVLTLLTEILSRGPSRDAASFGSARQALAQAGRRNAEVLRAMGMAGRTGNLWGEANRKYLAAHGRASDVGGGLGAVSRVFRMLLQSAILAVGAYLTINQQASGGIMLAASVMAGRALAPVETAVGNWKGFVAARQAYQRLKMMLRLLPQEENQMDLPAPEESLALQGLSLVPPGLDKLVVMDVSFSVKAGQGLGIIGPSGSGKSSLARALVGVWQPIRGRVRLDGASLSQWAPEALGQHIGYLPQDVELLDGTVEQNIARFTDAGSSEVIAAAKAASVHSAILALPQGYRTRIGESGAALPAGLRQRIALARALFRDPFLVVLDEPNSNLDSEGDQALTQAILSVRSRGGIVVVVAHRPSALAGVDQLLIMNQGRAQAFGPKEQVLQRVLPSSARPAAGLPPGRPQQVAGGNQGGRTPIAGGTGTPIGQIAIARGRPKVPDGR